MYFVQDSIKGVKNVFNNWSLTGCGHRCIRCIDPFNVCLLIAASDFGLKIMFLMFIFGNKSFCSGLKLLQLKIYIYRRFQESDKPNLPNHTNIKILFYAYSEPTQVTIVAFPLRYHSASNTESRTTLATILLSVLKVRHLSKGLRLKKRKN